MILWRSYLSRAFLFALFISKCANPAFQGIDLSAAKLSVLIASSIAAMIGMALLRSEPIASKL